MRQFLKTTAAAALVVAAPALALARSANAPAPAPALVAPADDTPPKDDEKKNEVTVWVLDASGKGWSAGKKARAAVDTFKDSIERALWSGTDVTLILKPGKSIEVDALKKALKDKGITFESFKSETRKKAKAAYVIETTGLTWADDSGKVRAALIELLGDKAQAVHADVKTVIHLVEAVELDVDAVEQVLKKLKVKHSGIERDDTYIL